MRRYLSGILVSLMFLFFSINVFATGEIMSPEQMDPNINGGMPIASFKNGKIVVDTSGYASREYKISNILKNGKQYTGDTIDISYDPQWEFEQHEDDIYTFDIEYLADICLLRGSGIGAENDLSSYTEATVSSLATNEWVNSSTMEITPTSQKASVKMVVTSGVGFVWNVMYDLHYDYILKYRVFDENTELYNDITENGTITIVSEEPNTAVFNANDENDTIYYNTNIMTYPPIDTGDAFDEYYNVQSNDFPIYTDDGKYEVLFTEPILLPIIVEDSVLSSVYMTDSAQDNFQTDEQPDDATNFELENSQTQEPTNTNITTNVVVAGVSTILAVSLGAGLTTSQNTENASIIESFLNKISKHKYDNFEVIINNDIDIPEIELSECTTVDVPFRVENGQGYDWKFICIAFLGKNGKNNRKMINAIANRTYENNGIATLIFKGDEIEKKQIVYGTVTAVANIDGKNVVDMSYFEITINPKKVEVE